MVEGNSLILKMTVIPFDSVESVGLVRLLLCLGWV